jgi:hypothetical protein
MNETNRLLIVLTAAAWIVAVVVVIFLTWAAPDRSINRLEDAVTFLRDNNTTAGQLVVSLAAAAIAVFALFVIIIEFAPEDEPRELKVEQAGATTIIPAEALRMRLEEALLSLPDVTAARSHVASRDKGIAVSLDLTVTPTGNVANVSQEAVRVVVDTVHTDLGLGVAGVPKVRIAFGGSRAVHQPAHVTSAPSSAPMPPINRVETVDERVTATPSPMHGDVSPEPLIHDETSGTGTAQTPQT